MDLRKNAERLAAREYTVQVIRDLTTDGELVYLALSPELEGCMGQGKTRDEALENLKDARFEYILSLLEDDLPVPEPQTYPTVTTSGQSATFTNLVDQQELSDEWIRMKEDPNASILYKFPSASIVT